MDEDQKETAANKEGSGSGNNGDVNKEAPPPTVESSTNEDQPPPAAKEEEEEKPSEKEDATMKDADEKQSTNGGGEDGTKEEEDTEAKGPADDDKKAAAPDGDTSSRKKKRAAPPPKTPASKASSSSADAAPVTTPEASASGGGGREKRARKALVAYAPVDFTKVDRSVHILPGRGVKLGSIRAVRASVEGSKDPALAELAHRLLFGGNKKPPKDAVKSNLLEFSGYLPPKPEGATEKELEAMDKKVEAKMGEKAFHLKVTEIRDLCDFFALERSKVNAKAELIDCLLDFLSEPSAEFVKGTKSAKASSSASKRKGGSGRKKKDESSEESEEEVEEEVVEAKPKKGKNTAVDLLKVDKGEVPADDTLRAWVRCFVQCYDLEKASLKAALQVAGDKFGVDLADKKELLKDMLSDAKG